MNLPNTETLTDSWDIYQTLCTSWTLHRKCCRLESTKIRECFEDTVAVLLNDTLILSSGSAAEGTDITAKDYNHTFDSSTPCYLSDVDSMNMLYHVRVNEEGDTLPQKFENYIYCFAERGQHTTVGYRKLRIVHTPKEYSFDNNLAGRWALTIQLAIEDQYISSSAFLAAILKQASGIPWKNTVEHDLGSQGPSQLMAKTGIVGDYVRCFYVKTWPQEAESWFTRQTHWLDKELKSKIKKIGYLLVPTGNSKSQESHIEWRCSFSMAEKILFQSMPKFERYTFLMLKVLLKEYLPSDINTDGEKTFLSTYHIKTLFLWCLEDRNLKWVPGDMLTIIGHMLNVLMKWIKQQHFPHYFIPSVNLIDGRKLNSRRLNGLMDVISSIRDELSKKIKHSNLFVGQESFFASVWFWRPCTMFIATYHDVMKSITGIIECDMNLKVFQILQSWRNVKFSHVLLLDGLIHVNLDKDARVEHFYKAFYTDPIHQKLLTNVVPGLINQYLGSIYLAIYNMTKRDSNLIPDALNIAQSLLEDTLNLDPCSGYVKLACLYIATENFFQAMENLKIAENNFVYMHQIIMKTAAQRASQREWVKLDQITTDFIHEVFHKWIEGQVPFEISVSWLEYNIVPDLLQFELIHESTQQLIDIPGLLGPGKMVALDCKLQWSPLSMIRLLKFICAFIVSQSSSSHMENLVADLIASGMSFSVFPSGFNDTYTVFNMAAWCYLKLRKYRLAARMMRVAIECSSEAEVIKRCAFSHYFVAYVITNCRL